MSEGLAVASSQYGRETFMHFGGTPVRINEHSMHPELFAFVVHVVHALSSASSFAGTLQIRGFHVAAPPPKAAYAPFWLAL